MYVSVCVHAREESDPAPTKKLKHASHSSDHAVNRTSSTRSAKETSTTLDKASKPADEVLPTGVRRTRTSCAAPRSSPRMSSSRAATQSGARKLLRRSQSLVSGRVSAFANVSTSSDTESEAPQTQETNVAGSRPRDGGSPRESSSRADTRSSARNSRTSASTNDSESETTQTQETNVAKLRPRDHSRPPIRSSSTAGEVDFASLLRRSDSPPVSLFK